LQKKIIISVIIILLLLVVGKCYYDHHKQHQTSIPINILLDKGIYLIDKNWDPIQKDSLLASHDSIVLLSDSIGHCLFVNIKKDSFIVDLSKIHSKNPILIFNKRSSPFITDLNNFSQAIALLYSAKKKRITSIDSIGPTLARPTITELTVDSIPRLIRDRLQYSELIKTKYIHAIPIKQKTISLKDAPIKALANRNLFYPIINNNQYLGIRFDNDFWDYTDYYYTNGIGISYSHPVFTRSPLSYLLISNGTNGIDYYGIQLIQHMYTGSQPKVDSIIPGDRPWASYSLLGQFLRSYDPKNKLNHYSEINIGIIGPESGGAFIQDLVHTILPNNSPPKGWHNQIAQDLLIDYRYEIQKLLWESKDIESYVRAGAQIGTLRDQIFWGFGGKLGRFIPFYQDKTIYHRKRIKSSFDKKFRFGITADIHTKFIAYDATLQGGVFNKSSIYTINSDDINRFVIEGFGGAYISYGRYELSFVQFWKSKEFKTGKDHKYASVQFQMAF